MPWAPAHGSCSHPRAGRRAHSSPTQLVHRAALGSMPSKAHHLRLDKSDRPWLTNCSPPGRPPPGNRGLAPTALKMPPLPGLRTDDLALTGVKKQVSQPSPLCSRESSPKSYGCLAPEGRHLECHWAPAHGPRSHRRAGRRAHSSPTQLVPSSRPWIHAIEGPPFAAR